MAEQGFKPGSPRFYSNYIWLSHTWYIILVSWPQNKDKTRMIKSRFIEIMKQLDCNNSSFTLFSVDFLRGYLTKFLLFSTVEIHVKEKACIKAVTYSLVLISWISKGKFIHTFFHASFISLSCSSDHLLYLLFSLAYWGPHSKKVTTVAWNALIFINLLLVFIISLVASPLLETWARAGGRRISHGHLLTYLSSEPAWCSQ